MTKRALWLAFLAIGCGGGSASIPPAEVPVVTGTFRGKSFSAANAVSYSATDQQGASGVVVISTSAALCSALQEGHYPPESINFVFHLTDVDAKLRTIAPTGAGNYALTDALIGSAKLGGGVSSETDAHCGTVASESEIWQRGTVTLTGAAGGLYSGSLNVWLSDASGAGGTFQSDPCPGANLVWPAPGC